MSILVTCPPGAQIADITVNACPVDMGQIQKVIFQRVYSSGTTRNSISVTNAAIEANWTALFTASDGTKVQITPFLHAPATEPGAAITFGGGNDTPDGIPLVVGREPTAFTGVFRQLSSASKKSLKSLEGEELGVFLVDEHGRIWGDSNDSASPTTLYPIPIRQLFIGDRDLGGFQEPDGNAVQWNFLPNWDDNVVSVTPSDFDALSDLGGS